MLPRVLTASVGFPILVAAIWWGAPWLTILVTLLAVLGIRELYRMVPPNAGPLPAVFGAFWVAALVLGAQAASGLTSFLLISAGVWSIGAFLAILWFIALYTGGRYTIAGIYLLAGPIYVGFLLAHSLVLRDVYGGGEIGRSWLLFAVLAAFATDTGAFYTGRLWGRRPMAPAISPGKTWEGAGGGLICAVVASLVLDAFLDLVIPGWQVVVIGATVGILAQCGDLLESKLKRVSGVKDAGSIIPGHGGVLDRLDSIVVSLPTVYYFVATVFRP
ncbi:MAG: phosphatidate cytidylyltransferase [Chloroflexi bacterium]|nr:phosphatidate cytidylyltransferase [Chloroflexota bacterium]